MFLLELLPPRLMLMRLLFCCCCSLDGYSRGGFSSAAVSVAATFVAMVPGDASPVAADPPTDPHADAALIAPASVAAGPVGTAPV